MKVNTFVTLLFFAIVKRQNALIEKRFDILGCPFGWKASGQVWYAPKYEKDNWINPNLAFASSTSDTYTFSQQNKNGYFPREHILCLICEYDLISVKYQGTARNERWIEVCGTNSTELKNKKLHFEMQKCY